MALLFKLPAYIFLVFLCFSSLEFSHMRFFLYSISSVFLCPVHLIYFFLCDMHGNTTIRVYRIQVGMLFWHNRFYYFIEVLLHQPENNKLHHSKRIGERQTCIIIMRVIRMGNLGLFGKFGLWCSAGIDK